MKNFVNVNKFLPDQCENAFFMIGSACKINRFYKPYKGAGILKQAIDTTIPAMTIYACAKDELSPPVVDIKRLDILYTGCDRP